MTDTRAVVLGGSMAGLLAARVLAETFDEVVVVERDELADVEGHRRGVPQDRHVHALAARGRQVLEELFPGLTDELVASGVPMGDLLGDVRAYFGGHRFTRAESGLVALSASRPRLEAHVRARVRALDAVRLRDRTDAVGLLIDRSRVVGARVLARADSSAEEAVHADLVVDATGRGSRLPRWLHELGHPAPPTDRVAVGIRYATRLYRLDPAALAGDLAILHGPTPRHPRGGVLAAIEGDRHVLTLFGMLDDAPPIDPDGFTAFARSLRFGDIADAVDGGEALGPPVGYRFPAGVRHRYDTLNRFPDGLLPVGDALCSFNPVYGQGITVAALQALALRRHLGRPRHPPVVLRELVRAARPAWDIATGADLAFPDVEGRRTIATRLLHRYVDRVQAAAAHDRHVALAFTRVSGLVDPPTALLRPAVARRVLARRPAEHEPTRR